MDVIADLVWVLVPAHGLEHPLLIFLTDENRHLRISVLSVLPDCLSNSGALRDFPVYPP